MFTTNAQNCKYCFLLARTDPESPKHAGLTVFLVPLDLPGISITPIGTLGDERTNLVFYDDVLVDDRYRVGPANEGWRVLNTQLDAEHGMTEGDLVTAGFVFADMLRELFDAAATWAFTERPGSERPVDEPDTAFMLARLALDTELAMIAAEPMRRVLAAELLNRNAQRVLDVVGADAIVSHGEAGTVADGLFERCLREAPATTIYGGTTEVFRNTIAERGLGLPHHRNAFTARSAAGSKA